MSGGQAQPTTTDPGAGEPVLEVLHADDDLPVEVVPAGRWRPWMQATSSRFANRCLPLLVANQAGWWLLTPHGVEATWDGGDAPGALQVAYDEGAPPGSRIAASHFGYGILSFNFRCWFRTPPGFNLLARGPANMPKDGIAALEGLVETDWTVVPFTMSWKLTRPGTVRFEAGEPFCQVVPQRRGELEAFTPVARRLQAGSEDELRALAWERTRLLYSMGKHTMREAGDETYRRRWMDDYFRGRSPMGDAGAEHQTTLRLKDVGRAER